MQAIRTVPPIAVAITIIAVLLLAASPALAEQTSAQDQYVDTGPTGNGIEIDPTGGVGGRGTDDLDGDAVAAPGTTAADGGEDADGKASAGGGGSQDNAPANATGSGQAGGGTLPLANYPLTPLVWLVLAILAVAVGFRIVVRLIDSRAAQQT